jgi:hypothetical protein|nr:MAG TPA: hypothetical protein [Caudoviricetes sp.]
MGFSITIQVDENYSMYLSNGYGDFSVGPLDKLARKYRHTGTYNEDSFKVEIDNVDDLADSLAETQQIAEEAIGDRVWNLKPDVLYSQDPQQYIREQILHDDGCYALVLGRVFDYLFKQDCLEFDHNTKSGYRLKDGKKIILRGS